VAITTTIDQYAERKQNFGMVNNAYVRVLNAETKEEIARYDLGEDYSLETAIIFGELYKVGSEWKFKAIGQGFTNGLAGLATNYGVNLA
jgi:tellurium resistance protein TerD